MHQINRRLAFGSLSVLFFAWNIFAVERCSFEFLNDASVWVRCQEHGDFLHIPTIKRGFVKPKEVFEGLWLYGKVPGHDQQSLLVVENISIEIRDISVTDFSGNEFIPLIDRVCSCIVFKNTKFAVPIAAFTSNVTINNCTFANVPASLSGGMLRMGIFSE